MLDFGFQQTLDSIGKKDLTVRGDPKRSETRVAINPPAAWLGARNAILWGKGKQYHVANFRGPLSIKSVVRGSARWSTSEAERLVHETSYLVLNSEQSYSITIDSLATVETFCLFFRNGLIEDVSRVTESGPTRLLDNPVPGEQVTRWTPRHAVTSSISSSGTRVEFFETLHPHDAVVSPLIQRIYARLKDNTASDPWLEDQFLGVAGALCELRREADKACRTNSSEEIFFAHGVVPSFAARERLHGLVFGNPRPFRRSRRERLPFSVSLPPVVSRGFSRDT